MVRRGFTLVEGMVALALGAVLLAVGSEAISLLNRGEKAVDRESSRALLEARLLESILQDVRSAVTVSAVADNEYAITRYILTPHGIETRLVTWRLTPGPLITRQADGEADQEFPFTGLVDMHDGPFRLKVEAVHDVDFVP